MTTPKKADEQVFEALEGIKSVLEANLSYPLFFDSTGGIQGETTIEEAEKHNEPVYVACNNYARQLLQVRIGAARVSSSNTTVESSEILEVLTKIEGRFSHEDETYIITLYESLDEFGPGQMRKFENILAAVKSLIEIINRNNQPSNIVSLQKIYKDIPGVTPVYPAASEDIVQNPSMDKKIVKIISYLTAGLSVAITSDSSVIKDYFLAHLAGQLMESHMSIATCTQMVPIRGLPELIQKLPGYVEFSAVYLSMASSPYERGDDVSAVMASIIRNGKPAIFSGNYSELQSIYGLGQGVIGNPLNPVIVELGQEDVQLVNLLAYELSTKDISPGRRSLILEQINECIEHNRLHFTDVDLLPAIINGSKNGDVNVANLLITLKTPTDTFRGFEVMSGQKRNPRMQQNLIKEIEHGVLEAYLKEHLVGQDKAIKEVVQWFKNEIITREQHLPIRGLFQSIPGTGKTESCKLLAKKLGIPYKNIDASNFTTGYDLRSTLYGSSTGIVQSYNPGLLELSAGHRRGCLVEVSDIDHAKSESIRAQIGDSFLSILQEGVIQTATGKTVFCGNVIFIFTINLPGQADEKVLKGLGFRSDLSEQEIFHNTMKEMKKMFSSAFISRVGSPILFSKFSYEDHIAIAEMAIRKGMENCFANLAISPRSVLIEPGSGEVLLNSFLASGEFIGARQIYEHVRGFITGQIGTRISAFKNSPSASPVKVCIKKNHLVLDF